MQTREEKADAQTERHTDTAIQEIESLPPVIAPALTETQPSRVPQSLQSPHLNLLRFRIFGITIRRVVSLKPVQIIAGLVLIMSVMGWIEFAGPAILDNDGYYHIRWARMLRESFPHLPPFKALPLTTLNEQKYVDHHYLFHVFVVSFHARRSAIGRKVRGCSLFEPRHCFRCSRCWSLTSQVSLAVACAACGKLRAFPLSNVNDQSARALAGFDRTGHVSHLEAQTLIARAAFVRIRVVL